MAKLKVETSDVEVTQLKIKGQKDPVEVTRIIDMGDAVHYYYVDPNDAKEKRVIRLKRRSRS